MSHHPVTLLRRLAGPPAAEPAPDADLLTRFVRYHDETAFAALVARHGPMVLAVCTHVLRDRHAAEDCVQATFLVLARRAASLRRPHALAAWLHGVALRVAWKARAETRRRPAEVQADPPERPDPHPDPLDVLSARELLALADEEIAQLPEAYRLAVLLCGREGRTLEEAARLLGWTPGSVRGRLVRGRRRLHARLVRRGLSLSAVPTVVELWRTAARVGMPAALVGATARAALAFAAGRGAGVSDRVLLLARAGLRGLAAARVRLAAVLLLAAGVVFAGAGMLAHQVLAARQPDAGQEADPPGTQAEGEAPARSDRYGDPLPDGVLTRLGTMRLRHGNGATLAFAPDGKSVLTCGGDRTIRTWDVADGRLLREQHLPPGQTSVVTVLSPDGRLLAFQDATSMDAVLLWDVEHGRLRHRLPLGEEWWHRAAFSPDGKTLVTAQNSGIVRAWDVATGQGQLLGRHKREVFSLSFTADGTLVTLSGDQTVRFWDLAAGRERSRLTLPEFTLGAVVAPDGRTVAVWSFHNPELDHGVRFLDAATGRPAEGWIAPDMKQVHAVEFTPDGKAVLIGMADGILVWDPKAGKRLRILPGRPGYHLAFAPDGKAVAALGTGKHDHPQGTVVRVWDLATGAPHAMNAAECGHLGEVDAVAFSADGREVASACQADASVRLWDARTGRLLRSLPARDLTSHALRFSPDGKHLFAGTSPAVIRWEVAGGREVARYPLAGPGEGHRYHLLILHLSDDGRTLRGVSQVLDGPGYRWALHAWDVATGKRLYSRPLTAGDFWVSYSGFSPDGRLVALPGGSLRDADTGEERLRLAVDGKQLGTPVAFSVDGALVAAGVWQEIIHPKLHGQEMVSVQVWELATGLPVVRLETGDAAHLAFTPDGRQLITAGEEGLRRWDLASGREVARRAAPGRFRGSYGASFASSFALAPDGRTLATGQPDTTVMLWDLPAVVGRPAAQLSADQLEACWSDLARTDAGRAAAAQSRLVDAAEQALPLLRERGRPAQTPSADDLRRLLAELDDPEFARREAATKRLAELGELAEAGLRAALRGKPSPEVRRRIEGLLAPPQLVRSVEARRALRAVRVLECVGTPEARQHLETLSRGAPEARVTQEAKASLQRRARRPASSP
jgi:RNA polymerase sigma factor (sigma-70 family)